MVVYRDEASARIRPYLSANGAAVSPSVKLCIFVRGSAPANSGMQQAAEHTLGFFEGMLIPVEELPFP
jgi:hypothetical protein